MTLEIITQLNKPTMTRLMDEDVRALSLCLEDACDIQPAAPRRQYIAHRTGPQYDRQRRPVQSAQAGVCGAREESRLVGTQQRAVGTTSQYCHTPRCRSTQVIICTPVVARRLACKFPSFKPHIILLEESGRMTEPDFMTAVGHFPSVLYIILSGDYLQIGPHVQSFFTSYGVPSRRVYEACATKTGSSAYIASKRNFQIVWPHKTWSNAVRIP